MELLWVFISGMVGYPVLEILWRGYSHITMAFAGGLCFTGLYVIARHPGAGNVFIAAFVGAAMITLVELIFGLVFNVVGGMNVWDYSMRPFNFLGQICLEYFVLWYLLSLVLIPLCRIIRQILV